MSDTSELVSQFYIKIKGAQVDATFMTDLESVVVENSLHLPDMATLTLSDPKLRWVDDETLVPGTPVEVTTKFNRKQEVIFDGEIVELEPEFGPENRLVIRAFDRLHRLARGRHARSFVQVKESDVVQQLAQEVGLSVKATDTKIVLPYLFQANETNLSMMQRCAAHNGFLLYVDGKTLCFVPPDLSKPAVELGMGVELSEFRPRLTTVGQYNTVEVRGWNPKDKKEVVGVWQDPGNPKSIDSMPRIGWGKSPGATANTFGKSKERVSESFITTPNEAEARAKAIGMLNSSRFIEASGVGRGHPQVTAGKMVKISNVGNRFSGEYFVTGSVHRYTSSEGYVTEFSVSGLSPSTLLGTMMGDGETASLPTFGVTIGIVTDNNDPENLGRVKVKFPWLTNEEASDWARVMMVGAGNQRGIQFMPEVNDEVVILFEQGNINHPFVLGGLWNGKDKPPKSANEIIKGGSVEQRIIRSREGNIIVFDDSSKLSILIETPGDLTLKAKGSITLDATGDIKINTKAGLNSESMGKTTIKGTAGADVDGGPVTNIKGGLINLN